MLASLRCGVQLVSDCDALGCTMGGKTGYGPLAKAFLAAAYIVLASTGRMQFKPPDREESIRAIGSTANLPEKLRRALTSTDDFKPIPAPGANDWLSNHTEPGQTFDAFIAARSKRPGGKHHRLYLQPLGEFAADQGLGSLDPSQFAR
jgi:hypothetical protein